jgi:TetR/AcrR family tetracycline transcriptional repressor
MAVTRDEVVLAAMSVLHQEGLAGLSLRRLAKELGISAPTLYWHVRDKRELLDLMAEKIILDYRRALPPIDEDTNWAEQVVVAMRRKYHALISHRDGPQVVAGNRPTEAMWPAIERWLGSWYKAGFAPDEALTAILSLSNYVLGSALEYQAEAERALSSTDIGAATSPIRNKAAYPNLQAAISCHNMSDRHLIFEHGLELMVAGLCASKGIPFKPEKSQRFTSAPLPQAEPVA